VLAVASDRSGTIYALAAEPKFAGLVVTRLVKAAPAGAASAAGGDDWSTFHRVPLVLPKGTTPGVSFAAVSPQGAMWVGLQARVGDGDPTSAGAVEIDLGSRKAVQHRPLAEGEKGAAEMLPLPPALQDVYFDPAPESVPGAGGLWFASLSGVSRWHQGELRTWGENEGLRSELVHAVSRGPGDLLFAATSEGVARFDGKSWRMVGDSEEAIVATRGLARDAAGRLWVATGKGLRLVTPADAEAQRPGELVLAGDMRDVRLDRDGRVWALSSASIALVNPGGK
jgi:ligand-binding sensor domain-containing protein